MTEKTANYLKQKSNIYDCGCFGKCCIICGCFFSGCKAACSRDYHHIFGFDPHTNLFSKVEVEDKDKLIEDAFKGVNK